MKDLMGQALLDFQSGNYSEDIITATHISYNDVLPVPYLFRGYDEMPRLEQRALDLCFGNVLDVGCAAGSHSLCLLEKDLEVTAIDISAKSIEVCKLRGIKNAFHRNLLDETGTYDSIISLMNGTGIFQSIKRAPEYLEKMRSLLKEGGQILIDSSDLRYMYTRKDLKALEKKSIYYGELEYYLSYKGESEEVMTWLYIDFDSLHSLCLECGLRCELVLEGDHYDYLARLSAI